MNFYLNKNNNFIQNNNNNNKNYSLNSNNNNINLLNNNLFSNSNKSTNQTNYTSLTKNKKNTIFFNDSLTLFPTYSLKDIETPEELHYFYVNILQDGKNLEEMFEKKKKNF